MSKVMCLLLTLSTVMVLSGCYSHSDNADSSMKVYFIQGKPLECLRLGSYRLSCNWEKYNLLK